MKKNKFNLLITIMIAFLLIGLTIMLQSGKTRENKSYAIVPLPLEMKVLKGTFLIKNTTVISGDQNNEGIKLVMSHLSGLIEKGAGLRLPLVNHAKQNAIHFVFDETINNPEGYRLKVTSNAVRISYSEARGAFYAVQTLRQLLPHGIEIENGISAKELLIPAVEIMDEPRFSYRGMHLDVCRHFFPVEFVKHYIDLLAMYKMNRFHWHLTEDQGWRIEIKKYPKLTEVGAWRKETLIGHYSNQPQKFDGTRYGGYYTQEEIREVVQYAADRFITVIPEIEMPGHALAALASYPWLGCFPERNYEVATKWGVFEDVFCPKEETFEFLENVLLEVMELFPSEYIHIGGDECPKTSWKECSHCQGVIKDKGLEDEHELQSYFITRMEKFLNKHGRQIIGWDEILEGGLAPNATVMSWRGEEGGVEAAEMGQNAIMTPVSHCYFDYYQSSQPGEPVAIGGFIPVQKVYGYEPEPVKLSPDKAYHILGAQGNVWTEYIKTGSHVEYMILPRMPALSEVVWTPAGRKEYPDFLKRIREHSKRWNRMNLNFANHIFEE